MPSISKTALDELTADAERAKATVETLRFEKSHLEQRVKRFDGILDKLVRAANGQPLTDDRNSGYGYGFTSGQVYPERMTEDEREAIKQQQIQDRIVSLESRLAAVVAVAQFAKDGKP